MLLIGIAGKKRSGKDTFCDCLIRELWPRQVVKRGFASSVKEEIAYALEDEEYGITADSILDQMYSDENKEYYRGIMQFWGTDYRRIMCEPDYWIKEMNAYLYKTKFDPNAILIIPDVRFKNEVDYIQRNKGYMVYVKRPSLDDSDTHISENGLYSDNITYDWVYNNSGTLEDLQESVREFIKLENLREEDN